jgi:transitional endoplasmic reticulum ATPase
VTDRTVQGERTVAMDDILNILDGIDGKGDNIITVLTTNHLENVNQAMLRPGRLDAIINIEPPNAKYGGQAIDEEESLYEVGKALEGQIPAVIEETVKRAKLFELAMQPKGHAVQGISAEAIRRSAVTMTTQIELLKEPESVVVPTLDSSMSDVVKTVVSAKVEDATKEIRKAVDDLKRG